MALGFTPSTLPVGLFDLTRHSTVGYFSTDSLTVDSTIALFFTYYGEQASVTRELHSMFELSFYYYFVVSKDYSKSSVFFYYSYGSPAITTVYFVSPYGPGEQLYGISAPGQTPSGT